MAQFAKPATFATINLIMRQSFIDWLRKLTPKPALEAFRNYKKQQIRAALQHQKATNQGFSQTDLVRDLKKMGLQAGDALLVHCAFSAIGFVKGGPQTLIDAFLEVLGPNGHLLMPTSPVKKLQFDHLSNQPVFDVRNTPSAMGALSETFRTQPGAVRSLHPTEPVSVLGPDKHWFVKDHFGEPTPYTENSPFRKLIDRNGKILVIGRDIWVAINLHTLEDAVPNFKFQVYADRWFDAQLIDENGAHHTMKTRAHSPELSKSRKVGGLTPVFERHGVLQHVQVGQAKSVLLDAKGMFDVMVQEYHQNGVTMYTPEGS